MIRGVHAMFYSSDPEATRAFLRDKLELPFVDVGEGWLIFGAGKAEIGSHPLMEEGAKPSHGISLYVDDLEAAIAHYTERGVVFKGEVEDQGWGLVTEIDVPGCGALMFYQPRYKAPGSSEAS